MAFATSTINRRARRRPTLATPHAGFVRWYAGFTIVEAMIASVVLAIAVVAIGGSLTASIKQSASVEQDSTSLLLARQLVEEIAAKPMADPNTGTPLLNAVVALQAVVAVADGSQSGSVATPGRATYATVGDYNGYTDTVDSTHPATSLQGKYAAVTNGRSYTRAVAVELRTTPAGTAASSGDFAMITVTVTPSRGTPVKVWRMVTNIKLKQGS